MRLHCSEQASLSVKPTVDTSLPRWVLAAYLTEWVKTLSRSSWKLNPRIAANIYFNTVYADTLLPRRKTGWRTSSVPTARCLANDMAAIYTIIVIVRSS